MDFNNTPHRRKNILTGEWVLVSPHRTKRPWQGKKDKPQEVERLAYDPNCYLCPGNERAGGAKNPNYTGTYSFQNDFAALLEGPEEPFKAGLLEAESESGKCKVICYSPNHSLTLPLMEVRDIEEVISLWQKEYTDLGSDPNINHVQIFENKGAIMGCSNPHPHGQIWAQRSIPQEVEKKVVRQKSYWDKNSSSLLGDYLKQELNAKERIVLENESFVALVPYWAVWPFEVMIIPKRTCYFYSRTLTARSIGLCKYPKSPHLLDTTTFLKPHFPTLQAYTKRQQTVRITATGICICRFIRHYCAQPRSRNLWWAMRCLPTPSVTSPPSKPHNDLRDCATTHYSNNKT
jgi:galactose-1-phosphate uridylyltransferase (family 1)